MKNKLIEIIKENINKMKVNLNATDFEISMCECTTYIFVKIYYNITLYDGNKETQSIDFKFYNDNSVYLNTIIGLYNFSDLKELEKNLNNNLQDIDYDKLRKELE